jgi:hypothetical protein
MNCGEVMATCHCQSLHKMHRTVELVFHTLLSLHILLSMSQCYATLEEFTISQFVRYSFSKSQMYKTKFSFCLLSNPTFHSFYFPLYVFPLLVLILSLLVFPFLSPFLSPSSPLYFPHVILYFWSTLSFFFLLIFFLYLFFFLSVCPFYMFYCSVFIFTFHCFVFFTVSHSIFVVFLCSHSCSSSSTVHWQSQSHFDLYHVSLRFCSDCTTCRSRPPGTVSSSTKLSTVNSSRFISLHCLTNSHPPKLLLTSMSLYNLQCSNKCVTTTSLSSELPMRSPHNEAKFNCVKSKVLTEVSNNNVTPCSVVGIHRYFGVTCCLLLQGTWCAGNMFFRNVGKLHHTTRRRVLDDSILLRFVLQLGTWSSHVVNTHYPYCSTRCPFAVYVIPTIVPVTRLNL